MPVALRKDQRLSPGSTLPFVYQHARAHAHRVPAVQCGSHVKENVLSGRAAHLTDSYHLSEYPGPFLLHSWAVEGRQGLTNSIRAWSHHSRRARSRSPRLAASSSPYTTPTAGRSTGATTASPSSLTASRGACGAPSSSAPAVEPAAR